MRSGHPATGLSSVAINRLSPRLRSFKESLRAAARFPGRPIPAFARYPLLPRHPLSPDTRFRPTPTAGQRKGADLQSRLPGPSPLDEARPAWGLSTTAPSHP
jgi:hypothetical protein